MCEMQKGILHALRDVGGANSRAAYYAVADARRAGRGGPVSHRSPPHQSALIAPQLRLRPHQKDFPPEDVARLDNSAKF